MIVFQIDKEKLVLNESTNTHIQCSIRASTRELKKSGTQKYEDSSIAYLSYI